MPSPKRGDVRADGHTYQGSTINRNGTLCEQWLSPKAMETVRFRIAERNVRRRAKVEGCPHNITAKYLRAIYPKDGLCPILKTPLVWGDKQGRTNSPSLDRRIPEAGYVEGNVGFISNRINNLKNNLSLEEIERLVAHIKGSL